MEQLNKLAARIVREHMLAVETLTEQQLVSAFAQSIRSGDFVRHVQKIGNEEGQKVVYLPLYQKEILDGRIENMKLGIETVLRFLDLMNTKGCKRSAEILRMAINGEDVSNEQILL